MKVAVIGSRGLYVDDFSPYLPEDTTEIISGGAKGIDACVKRYAEEKHIPLVEILPDYTRYGRKAAPILRNQQIADRADVVVAFWDGASRGTQFTIRYCEGKRIPLTVIPLGKT